jgi:hypothetical protein
VPEILTAATREGYSPALGISFVPFMDQLANANLDKHFLASAAPPADGSEVEVLEGLGKDALGGGYEM